MRFPVAAHVLLFLGWSVALVPSSYADDPCATFTWDVAHERTLFGREPQSLAAGQALAASPLLMIDRLYRLQLKGQSEVTFVAPPGGKTPRDARTYAGLALFAADTGGVYRIALDQRLWVDVVVNGSLVPAKGFQGRPGCNTPHKIVEFVLPAKTTATLQFSAGSMPRAKVTVTRSPGD